MRWLMVCLFVAGGVCTSFSGQAQGMLEDVLAGKLVKPEVGVFAWYEVLDATTETRWLLRQAVVGRERVGKEWGYWVETEVMPQVGFPVVYKMLLTGPANDSRNVHRIIMQQGGRAPQELAVEPFGEERKGERKTKQERVGMETVDTPQGKLEAERFVVRGQGEADKEGMTEVWLNDAVRPMGLVRLKSAQGELMLRRYGKGGKDGQSLLKEGSVEKEKGAEEGASLPDRSVRKEEEEVKGEVKKNFGRKGRKP